MSGHIHLVSSSSVSRRVVQEILLMDHKMVSLAVKQIHLDEPGDIVLVQVATLAGDVFIFDVKQCKDIMHDGHLWRILETDSLQKVMHDCRFASATLRKQFGVTLRNVFDTQAAYCLLLMQRELPPRLIHLHHLYEKFGDPGQRIDKELKESVDAGGIYWARRPMSNKMLRSAASDVLALIPAVVENLQRDLSAHSQDVIEELCYAYIHGKFQHQLKHTSASCRPRRRPVVRISEDQAHLLSNTVPQAAGCLTYK